MAIEVPSWMIDVAKVASPIIAAFAAGLAAMKLLEERRARAVGKVPTVTDLYSEPSTVAGMFRVYVEIWSTSSGGAWEVGISGRGQLRFGSFRGQNVEPGAWVRRETSPGLLRLPAHSNGHAVFVMKLAGAMGRPKSVVIDFRTPDMRRPVRRSVKVRYQNLDHPH